MTIKDISEKEEIWNKLQGFVISKDGYKCYRNSRGELHREDGPAVDGGDIQLWYLNGVLLQPSEHALLVRN